MVKKLIIGIVFGALVGWCLSQLAVWLALAQWN